MLNKYKLALNLIAPVPLRNGMKTKRKKNLKNQRKTIFRNSIYLSLRDVGSLSFARTFSQLGPRQVSSD